MNEIVLFAGVVLSHGVAPGSCGLAHAVALLLGLLDIAGAEQVLHSTPCCRWLVENLEQVFTYVCRMDAGVCAGNASAQRDRTCMHASSRLEHSIGG